jgi:PAS domain S-box-containing protein
MWPAAVSGRSLVLMVAVVGMALLFAGVILEEAPLGPAHVVQIAGLILTAAAAIAAFARRPGEAPASPQLERFQALSDSLEKGIEKLKDLEWELSDNEARYRDLLDAQTDIITRCDTGGRLTFINRAFCRTFGVEAGEVLGTVFEPEVLQREGDGRSAPEPGRRLRFEELIVTADGARWFAFEQQAITGDDGRVREIQLLGRDVTEQRRTQLALAEARDQAEAANRAKSRFLAAMSHEIRTPMNGILGMTSLLVETTITPEQRSYLSAVELSAKNLLTIIDEILDLSKIEAGKLEIHPAPFALDDCLRSVIELMAPRAQEKNLDLAWRIDPDLPRIVIGDETRVRQILLNLVGNAVKFTDTGGVAVRVKRAALSVPTSSEVWEAYGPQRLGLLLEIEDTGAGIAADQMRNIFAEFEQADDAARRKRSGTGLGLAISRSLARAMGGDIAVRSALGQGSTFAARIVVLGQPSSPPVLRARADRAARHILIASSRTQQRALMQETLDALGVASTAASLDAAIEIASSTGRPAPAFDTVIADAEEGVDSIRRLVAAVRVAGRRSPRAILVVDQPGGDRLEAFRAVGCDAYLVRPVRPSSLLTQLELGPETEDERSRRPSEPAPTALAGPQAGPPRSRRILLVEDNDINALLARRMSEKAGCIVHHAASGPAALAWCEELLAGDEAVDLVLMDIHMPEMDGFETARRIKCVFAARSRISPPIIALTANAFAEDRKRCLDAGFEDYLAKPFDRAELEALLEKWCAAERAPRDGSLGEYAA